MHPDFIFVNYNISGMNGLQFLEKIREIKTLDAVTCILYSNHIDARAEEKCMTLNARYIRKPQLTGLLASRLKEIFLPGGEKKEIIMSNQNSTIERVKESYS
jgi:two-component SAPR family response regulator